MHMRQTCETKSDYKAKAYDQLSKKRSVVFLPVLIFSGEIEPAGLITSSGDTSPPPGGLTGDAGGDNSLDTCGGESTILSSGIVLTEACVWYINNTSYKS